MRMRGVVVTLILALICGVSAGGCQVIAGLTVLEVTGTTSAGGQGGQGGGAACHACANGEPCADGSDCQSGFCSKSGSGAGGAATAGICKATKALGIGCTIDDECGTGYCTDGVCCKVDHCASECSSCAASDDGSCKPTVGVACGDKSSTACSAPDTCDAAGNCLPNHAVVGTPCGTACGDGEVVTSLCDGAGVCSGQETTPCSANYGCNTATKQCNASCNASSDCADSAFCAIGVKSCAPCGVTPPDPGMCTPGQGGCESCDPSNNTCVTTCDTVNECSGSSTKMLNATKGPARLVCKDQCNGLNVICQGPFPCEVSCDSGGCAGLVLNCGPDGPCKLTCAGTGCAGVGATMNCGDNGCNASCTDPASTVKQSCGGSCGCSKVVCQ